MHKMLMLLVCTTPAYASKAPANTTCSMSQAIRQAKDVSITLPIHLTGDNKIYLTFFMPEGYYLLPRKEESSIYEFSSKTGDNSENFALQTFTGMSIPAEKIIKNIVKKETEEHKARILQHVTKTTPLYTLSHLLITYKAADGTHTLLISRYYSGSSDCCGYIYTYKGLGTKEEIGVVEDLKKTEDTIVATTKHMYKFLKENVLISDLNTPNTKN